MPPPFSHTSEIAPEPESGTWFFCLRHPVEGGFDPHRAGRRVRCRHRRPRAGHDPSRAGRRRRGDLRPRRRLVHRRLRAARAPGCLRPRRAHARAADPRPQSCVRLPGARGARARERARAGLPLAGGAAPRACRLLPEPSAADAARPLASAALTDHPAPPPYDVVNQAQPGFDPGVAVSAWWHGARGPARRASSRRSGSPPPCSPGATAAARGRSPRPSSAAPVSRSASLAKCSRWAREQGLEVGLAAREEQELEHQQRARVAYVRDGLAQPARRARACPAGVASSTVRCGPERLATVPAGRTRPIAVRRLDRAVDERPAHRPDLADLALGRHRPRDREAVRRAFGEQRQHGPLAGGQFVARTRHVPANANARTDRAGCESPLPGSQDWTSVRGVTTTRRGRGPRGEETGHGSCRIR